jgi:beta-glucosidase
VSQQTDATVSEFSNVLQKKHNDNNVYPKTNNNQTKSHTTGEYIPGEDATLGVLAAYMVQGLQSANILVSAKHFVIQLQELNRHNYVAVVDEATLMETYIRAFVPSINAGTSTVMCAYNKIKVSEHPETTAELCGSDHVTNYLLRDVLGFKGAVISDWSATQDSETDGEATINRNVIDWEMNWGHPLDTPVDITDDAAMLQHTKNTLIALLTSGAMPKPSECANLEDPKAPTDPPPLGDVPDVYKVAFESGTAAAVGPIVVAESMVLLKNDNDALPLVPPIGGTATIKVLLAGEALTTGGGSGDSAAFSYEFPDHNAENLANNGGPFAQAHMVEKLMAAFGEGSQVHWEFDTNNTLPMTEYNVIISFASNYRGEGYLTGDTDGFYELDRCDSSQDYLARPLWGTCDYPAEIAKFQAARTAGTKLISVTTIGGAFKAFDYINDVDAALTMYYPGQYFADALANVLVGKVSPGGKLISTLPDLEADNEHIQSPIARFNPGLSVNAVVARAANQRTTITAPGVEWNEASNEIGTEIVYDSTFSHHTERNLVGYKYYEKYGMIPLFPFGFGLSYQTPTVSSSFADGCGYTGCTIRASVDGLDSDNGQVASTVVQVYVGYVSADSADDTLRPIKELRGFKKVWKSGDVEVSLGTEAFVTSWDVSKQKFVLPCELTGSAEEGTFTVYVGTSSDQATTTTTFACGANDASTAPDEPTSAASAPTNTVSIARVASTALVAVTFVSVWF